MLCHGFARHLPLALASGISCDHLTTPNPRRPSVRQYLAEPREELVAWSVDNYSIFARVVLSNSDDHVVACDAGLVPTYSGLRTSRVRRPGRAWQGQNRK